MINRSAAGSKAYSLKKEYDKSWEDAHRALAPAAIYAVTIIRQDGRISEGV
jgi:hypothetical protein